MMVFDLGPDEGMSPDTVRRGVLDIKGLLEALSLRSFLKTSGGKGRLLRFRRKNRGAHVNTVARPLHKQYESGRISARPASA